MKLRTPKLKPCADFRIILQRLTKTLFCFVTLFGSTFFIYTTQAQDPGVVVADGNKANPNQLAYPSGVFVDSNGAVYIADRVNFRVQKWLPGATTGVTVAGGNGPGAAPNQLSNNISGIFVDTQMVVYIADRGNHRVQKWVVGATQGLTVAGGNGWGLSPNQLSSPTDIYVDSLGTVYIADGQNSRIQKWAVGSLSGTTVAGGNGFGDALNQMKYPSSLWVDNAGAIYVCDYLNSRVQRWLPGATTSILVAGGNGQGSASNQLSVESGKIFVDNENAVYVADDRNHRVQKWASGANQGTTVAGGNGYGSGANELGYPTDVHLDASGAMFIADQHNHRIQKWIIGSLSGTTVAGGNGFRSTNSQLNEPTAVFVDGSGAIYINDRLNHRVQKWFPGSTAGFTVAGGNGAGSANNQLNNPSAIFVANNGDLYISDSYNNRIQKWIAGANAGVTVAGGNGVGQGANQISSPSGLFVTQTGDLYITDPAQGLYRIQKWIAGANTGVTVAGGNGTGSAANQFHYNFRDLFVDASGAIYVADEGNHRIQKWAAGAMSGTTVAGGNDFGDAPNQLSYPRGIFVDRLGSVYGTDSFYRRVKRWAVNATNGATVAGYPQYQNTSSELYNPNGLFINNKGELYVADTYKNRIVKYCVDTPIVTQQPPSSLTVCLNSSVSTSVVISGISDYQYAWYKGPEELTPRQRTPVLSLSNVQSSDADSYILVALSCKFVNSNYFVLSITDQIRSLKNGLWTDPSVWSCSRVPAANDQVVLQHIVTIPENATSVGKNIRFFGSGQLLFNSPETRLRLGF